MGECVDVGCYMLSNVYMISGTTVSVIKAVFHKMACSCPRIHPISTKFWFRKLSRVQLFNKTV